MKYRASKYLIWAGTALRFVCYWILRELPIYGRVLSFFIYVYTFRVFIIWGRLYALVTRSLESSKSIQAYVLVPFEMRVGKAFQLYHSTNKNFSETV